MAGTNTEQMKVELPMTEDGHAMIPGQTIYVVDMGKPRRRPIRDSINSLIWLGPEAGWMVSLRRCDVFSVPSDIVSLFHDDPRA